jgi:hypothetical protein
VKSSRALFVALIVICAAILLRFPGHFSLGGTILGHDWYTMHRIDALHVRRAHLEGSTIAAWSPWILGGTPLFSVATKPFSYPPFVLAASYLSAAFTMNLLLLLHLFGGSFGTFLFARRLGLQGLAPLLCAVLFVLARFPAFGFTSTPYGFGYAVCWWPWSLLVILDLLEGKRSLRAGTWLGIFAALQWHAGGEPSLYWLGCFSSAFAIPYLIRPWKKQEMRQLAGGVCLAALVFFGLIAIKLIPELAWLESSGRSVPLGVEFARDSALEEELMELGNGSRLLTLRSILWRQYAGAGFWSVGLGVLLGLFVGWRKRAWLALAAGTMVCFVLASGALHELAYDWMPGYDRMRRHSRFVLAVGFGASLLAGFGWQWVRTKEFGWRAVALGSAACVALLWDTGSLPGAKSRGRQLDAAQDRLALSAGQLEVVTGDSRYGRLSDNGIGEQGAWVALGIESIGGALGGPGSGNAIYDELVDTQATAAQLERKSRSVLDALNVRYMVSYEELKLPGLELVAESSQLSPANLQRLKSYGTESSFLYERSSARSRAVVVQNPTLVVGTDLARRRSVAKQLRSEKHDAKSRVLAEAGRSFPMDVEDVGSVLFSGRKIDDLELLDWARSHPKGELTRSGQSVLWERSPTRMHELLDQRVTKSMDSIEVDVSGQAGFLLLSELTTLHPGWSATVDGHPVEILRADGLVSLVKLPLDARLVRFEFSVPGLRLGAWITAATLVALLLCVLKAAISSSSAHKISTAPASN